MKRMHMVLAVMVVAATVGAVRPAEKPTPREALQKFQDLIGSWRCTGQPEGSREEQRKGFWTEGMSWEWQFKGNDAWLHAAIEKGKYFDSADLRYLPDKDLYQLTASTPAKETLVFQGA